MAVTAARMEEMDTSQQYTLTETSLKKALDDQFGTEDTAATTYEIEEIEEGWKVTKTYTNTYYAIINGNGNIEIEQMAAPEVSQKYTITYETDNGTIASTAPNEYEDGEMIDFPTPERSGYAFDGWYTDSTKTGNQVVSTMGMTGNITLYAKWAEETPTDYFNWTVSNGKATITGFSELGLSVYNDDTNENHSKVVNLVIPKKYIEQNETENDVTGIGVIAFKGKDKIEKLVIHDGVQSMGQTAFESCTGLKELKIPITMNYNGYWSNQNPEFKDCINIEKVTLSKGTTGEGIDYISNENYNKNNYYLTPWYLSRSKIKTIIIEEGITKLGNYAFYDQATLEKIEIPSTLISVGEQTFYNCKNLELNTGFIKKLTSIGSFTFYNCENLTGELEFSQEIKNIPVCCFYGCKGITKITIHDGIQSMGQTAFALCTELKELKIPITMNYNGGWGNQSPEFKGCTNIEKITLSKGTTGEGIDYTYTGNANNYCSAPWYISRSSIKTVIIGEGITKVGNYTFCDLPNTVSYYARGASGSFTIGANNGNFTTSNITYDYED